jgi:5-enolpyruvylshikimate-3-phosphate synthase
MAAAVVANAVAGPSRIGGWAAVESSFPEFPERLAALTGGIA